MEIRSLRYFITVVENSSFTAAASILHISQPSISNAIRNLENNLGLELIDRSTRNLKLTKEGEILFQEAKKLISHFDYVSSDMERLRLEGPLELSIGLIESSNFWALNILTNFKKKFPEVRIKIFEVLSLEEVEESLINFDIHMAITNQYISNPDIQIVPLYEERLVALIPLDHRLKSKNRIEISDLKDEVFIISKEGFQTRKDILNAFQKEGIKPNIQFEISRFETACMLVENNLGITVVPENYVKYSQHRSLHTKRIKNSNISRMVYLAFIKNRYIPPLVQNYIQLVKSFFHKTF